MENLFGGLLGTIKGSVFGGLLQDDDQLLSQYVPPAVRNTLSPEDQQDLIKTIRGTTTSTLLNKGTSQDRFNFVQQQAFNNLALKQAQAKQAEQQAVGRAADEYIAKATQPTVDGSMALSAQGLPAGPTNDRAALVGQANPNRIDLNQARANAYMQMAQRYANAGQVEAADKYLKLAQSFNPAFEYATTVTVRGEDGRPVERIIGKDGRRMDVGGKAYERKDRDIGGQIQSRDPFTDEVFGTTAKTKTFADITAEGNLGVAQRNASVNEQQLGLSRDRLELERGNQGKPTWSNEAGGWVYPPSKQNPNGSIVAPAGMKPKAPTEFQGKAAGFGARAEEADRIITELTGKYSPAAVNSKVNVGSWPIVGGIAGAVTNGALSKEDQMAEQAQRDFINAVLRQESGAAIGAQEFDNAAKQYFPQPNDDKATIALKKRNRELTIQGFKQAAGTAAFSAPASTDGWTIKKVQ